MERLNLGSYSLQAIGTTLATLRRPHSGGPAAVNLTDAIRVKCVRPLPWAAILAVLATQEGYGAREKYGRFDWKRDCFVPDVNRFWGEVLRVSATVEIEVGYDSSVSAKEAAAILQIHNNRFYELAQSGALDSCVREWSRYDRAALNAFKDEHLYGSRLARRCGSWRMNGSVAKRLYELGVRDAFPNTNIKMFRARDVEAAIPNVRHIMQL